MKTNRDLSNQLGDWLEIRELIERCSGMPNSLKRHQAQIVVDAVNNYQETYKLRFNYWIYEDVGNPLNKTKRDLGDYNGWDEV